MRLPRVRFTVRRMIVAVALVAGAVFISLWLTDPYPEGWKSEEFNSVIRHAVNPDGKGNVEPELLAWSIREDDRPLLVDNALVWARVETGSDVKWALLLLYRHPRIGPAWFVSSYSHGPTAVQFYMNPPRNLEVYAFL